MVRSSGPCPYKCNGTDVLENGTTSAPKSVLRFVGGIRTSTSDLDFYKLPCYFVSGDRFAFNHYYYHLQKLYRLKIIKLFIHSKKSRCSNHYAMTPTVVLIQKSGVGILTNCFVFF